MSLYLVQVIEACPDYKRPSANVSDLIVCETMNDVVDTIIRKLIVILDENEFKGENGCTLDDYGEWIYSEAYMEMPAIEVRVSCLHDKQLDWIRVDTYKLFEQAFAQYRQSRQD